MSEADDRYPTETLHEDYDDGTMPDNVDRLAAAVVGRRIVSVEKDAKVKAWYPSTYRPYETATVITLDDGRRVALRDTDDCCAYTALEAFLLHPERVDHIITGVGTTDGFTRWHIYADMGDVLELEVGWSCGNPFYYGYGFNITVESVADAVIESEVGGLDRAGRLALASPYSRREWGLALEIMGSRADELLPTVQELSAIGWAPSAAAINLLKVLDA